MDDRLQASPDPAGVYVIVPAYNEAATVRETLGRVVRAYPNVVLVDDGSSDDTADIARPIVPFVLRHLINRGQGAALQTGIEFAIGRDARYIVTFDADGQHRVEDIALLLAPLADGSCDVTLGSRFLGETLYMPASRRVMLRAGVSFTRLVSRLPVTDVHNGLRAFTGDAARKVNITMDRMAHASEIVDIIRTAELRFQEVPVQIRYTAYSLSKGQSLRDVFRVLFHYLVGRAVR